MISVSVPIFFPYFSLTSHSSSLTVLLSTCAILCYLLDKDSNFVIFHILMIIAIQGKLILMKEKSRTNKEHPCK